MSLSFSWEILHVQISITLNIVTSLQAIYIYSNDQIIFKSYPFMISFRSSFVSNRRTEQNRLKWNRTRWITVWSQLMLFISESYFTSSALMNHLIHWCWFRVSVGMISKDINSICSINIYWVFTVCQALLALGLNSEWNNCCREVLITVPSLNAFFS